MSKTPAYTRIMAATPINLGAGERYLDPVDREKTRRRARVGMIARARNTTRTAADRWLRRLSDQPRRLVPDDISEASIAEVEAWAERGRP
jgi:hypothetical protein